MQHQSALNEAEQAAAIKHAISRIRFFSVLLMGGALIAGTAVGLRDPKWALLAAAVVFGWSQIGGA